MPGDDEHYIVTISAALHGSLTPDQILYELSYAAGRRIQLAYYCREGNNLRLRRGVKGAKEW